MKYSNDRGSRARKRRALNLKHKRKLIRQTKTLVHYPAPCWMVDKNNDYTDDEKEMKYVKKYYKSSHCTRYRDNKKIASKAVRRLPNTISLTGGEYRKVYDYKWSVD